MTTTIDTSRDAVERALRLAVTNRHITPAIERLALALLERAETAEVAARYSALQELASLGQAADAHDAQLKAEAERDALHNAQPYRYIGKDGKAVLARDLEDQRDALQAEVARLRGALTVIGHCKLSCCEAMDAENRRHARTALEAKP